MAIATAVNAQITDSVTQSSVQTLSGIPAIAAGLLQQATAQAMANAAHNAASAQQQANLLAQATSASASAMLLQLGSDPFNPTNNN